MIFSAVILAGGKSSRMGRDKARLILEGRTLLDRQIQLARDAGAVDIFLSGRAGEDYAEFGLPILHDRITTAGPLAGIERALEITRTPLLLVLAVDLPDMNVDVLGRLKALCTADHGVIPRLGAGIEPLAAFYPKAAHALAVKQLTDGDNAVRHFAEVCVRSQLAVFHDIGPAEAGCFANWNTPADLSAC